ncbi:hypothetical protein JKF63_00687 [Porcisia hertigi]|uniref:Uncharacterized protein n=1 Tax=Porcisia hertigi TaxID=2761500 RepID=A0A836KYK0_9TRYP|nr:hypothetical protein JKF63_00687 [Porcisia hertigi]
MNLRTLSRRLAPHATHSRVQAVSPSSSRKQNQHGVAPLLQFPQFHPISFPQDKFLSIKSRSLETYTKVRGDVLQRCANLCAQLQRQQEHAQQRRSDVTTLEETMENKTSSSPTVGTSSQIPSHPLTPHQAEELLLLTKKVEDLVQYQGFLLTDELVWRMLHLCIQCGAPQLAVGGWLQKHVLEEKRGPPFPLFILEDLTAALRFWVLPRLPESGANLTCSSVVIAASSGNTQESRSVAFEDGLAAAQRFLWFHHLHPGLSSSIATTAEVPSAAQAYTSHLFKEHVWPVWQALEAMNLTFADLGFRNVEDAEEQKVVSDGPGDEKKADTRSSRMDRGEEDGRHAAWLPHTETQTLAVRTALMSVTPLYSFHAPTPSALPSNIAEDTTNSSKTARSRAHTLLCNAPPLFPSEAAAIVAPLRALLDTWLVLAQCAAEAKDVLLLKTLLRAVCLGFLVHPVMAPRGKDSAAEVEDGVPAPPVGVNEDAWCQYAASGAEQAKDEAHRRAAELQARAMVREFVNGSLSVLQYGLLCAEQDAALWQLHDTCALVFGCADTLRSLQGSQRERQRRSLIAHDSKLHRMSAVVLAQSASTEEGDGVLLSALSCALISCFARGHQAASDIEHASATGAIHAFVRHALAHPAGETTVHPYAEAGLYVALFTGDEALLAQAAPSDKEMNTSEATLLLLHARALRSYRTAAMRLATEREVHDDEAPGEDAWHVLTEALQQEVLHVTAAESDTDTPRARFMENCLTVLTLGVARRQAKSAATFVQCVQQHTTTPTSGEGKEGGDGTSDEHHNSYDNVEAEKQRQEVIEVAWAQFYDGTNACTRDALTQVEKLLDASPSHDGLDFCLSPSSLSTLAMLTRLGVYAEEEAQASAAVVSAGGPTSIAGAENSGSHPPSFPLSTTLDRVLARMVRDTCTQLRSVLVSSTDGAAPTAKTSVVGNWVQWVLLTLMSRRAWSDVLAVLCALDGEASAESPSTTAGSTNTLLCSATVDPSVFAALYARALEDGAASVCAFLRPRRERLFF